MTGDSVPSEPLKDDAVEVNVTSTEVPFHGAVWNIRRDAFDYNGQTIRREYVEHTGAVAVLVEDDEGRILLIKQYRHPVRSRDWELPAGLLDIEGEEPLVAARRELAEEADLEASTWEPLVTFNTSPGGSDEVLYVFHASNPGAAPQTFDREAEEADIEVRWVPLQEVVDGILDGRLHNSILSIAALALHAKKGARP
ncbi:NUDIX domain-containing protein [Frondihabitans australicus]|uniref:NUDIX domain-containing protein n=1 Tax=Frondihabitans australicus TaxID=386892 RepID=UPI001FE32E58|nr:NUDIX hydrolase [Frondihabitans australicus]